MKTKENSVKAKVGKQLDIIEEIDKKATLDKWRDMDLKKVVRQDIQAAASLLLMIRDTPQIFDAIVEKIEDIRAEMLKNERREKSNVKAKIEEDAN